MNHTPLLQFHIRWSSKTMLDWESFKTRKEAEASANQLVRSSETYTIEQRDETCPRCTAASILKTDNGSADGLENLKYPWQQVVFDAFVELNPRRLPRKINAAEQAIAAKLCDPVPSSSDEQRALREALASLRAIFPQRARRDISRETKVG